LTTTTNTKTVSHQHLLPPTIHDDTTAAPRTKEHRCLLRARVRRARAPHLDADALQQHLCMENGFATAKAQHLKIFPPGAHIC
jgi:hypothetical protein